LPSTSISPNAIHRAFTIDLLHPARGLADLATRAQFLDFTETNWFAALAAAGVPEDVREELEEAFGAIPSAELFPEMAAVIERLAAAHPVVIITSSRTDVVEGSLAKHGVRGVVEVRGGEQEASKTRKICSVRRRFGETLPAWYVCDTAGDVLEAQAARVGAGRRGLGLARRGAPASGHSRSQGPRPD